jgi:(p)ppGpp synthase/HD superfamily hydrolase
MTDDALIARIRHYADVAHGEQKRKYTPERYIVHPERVMHICREYTDDVCILAAALLHDVLEDTPITRTQMLAFLKTQMTPEQAQRTLDLVVELTDVYTWERYPEVNRKERKAKEAHRLSKTSPEAQSIKYADILDNCTEVVRHDVEFARRYVRECEQFLEVMDKGDQRIFKRAMATIRENKKILQDLRP